jgi:cytochrome c oxidase subunit 2
LAAWASAAGLAGITEVALAFPPFNMPEGVTEVSHTVHDLHMLVFWICVAIGVGVFGVMFYSMYKHRKSKGHEAAQFHESTKVEVIWTVIPFAILIGIAIPATRALINMENTSDPEMTVKVTGYQWKWHYDYLDDGISFYSSLSTPGAQIYNQQKKGENYLLEVNNEVVLPVGKKIRFLFTANDVIHSWWVPDLAVKQDAIPGFINEKWTRIDKPGIYRGQCAELCGRFHGFMPIVVRAVTQNEYDAWVAQHKGTEKVAAASERPPAQGQVQN